MPEAKLDPLARAMVDSIRGLPANVNTLKIRNTDNGEVTETSLVGPDGKADVEKIRRFAAALKPDQRRDLKQQLDSEVRRLTQEREGLEHAADYNAEQFKLLHSMREKITAWSLRGFNLQRPSASVAHRFATAMQAGEVMEHPQIGDQIKALGPFKPVSFVVEHDWAAAFEGAEDIDKGEVRPPFDEMVFEFRVSDVPVLLYIHGESRFLLIEVGGQWVALLAATFEKRVEAESWLMDPLDRQVRAICIALDAEVAITETVRAPEKLNRQRAKKGRPPLLDYHVIRLNRRQRAAPLPDEHEGGEAHRKHRLHFVRGHWRHYDNHRTWVKWHMRGDPDLGFIDKHYRL